MMQDVMEYALAELVEASRYRESIYRLASSVFADEPSEEFLHSIVMASNEESDIDHIDAPERKLLTHMQRYHDVELGELARRLRTEYAELFVGPRVPRAPVFESLYLGYPKRLFTEITRQVRGVYEENGFQVVARNHIPDDHMAYELEFMAHLCARSIYACEQAADALTCGCRGVVDNIADDVLAALIVQYDFLRQHLHRWTPLIAHRIDEADFSHYYAAWGQFVDEFITSDISRVAEAIATLMVPLDKNSA